MTGKVVGELAGTPTAAAVAAASLGEEAAANSTVDLDETYTPVQVAAVVALMIGIIQVGPITFFY